MKNLFLLLSIILLSSGVYAQQTDSLSGPLLDLETENFLKKIDVNLDLRTDFLIHFEDGDEWDSDYTEFRARHVALQIAGQVTDRISFRFRNRFNREAKIQSLDFLDESVELAYIDLKLSEKTNLQMGKMFAYFGGFEYEFNPIYVLEYNDIQNNLRNYVTGAGITHKLNANNKLGFQALNSRTQHFMDAFGDRVPDGVTAPKWPLALVANWEGSLFDGKLQTLYSYSHFRLAKGHATTNAITLGHKYQHGKLAVMYDFNYSNEQLDSKEIVTDILGGDLIAQDASYLEHWVRAEYEFSPKLTGLLTLMTSNAYGKNVVSSDSGNDLLRTSYGIVPTVYYRPFNDYDLRFYLGFISRIYHYSNYAKNNLGMKDFNTGEIRLGVIVPIWLF